MDSLVNIKTKTHLILRNTLGVIYLFVFFQSKEMRVHQFDGGDKIDADGSDREVKQK